MRAGERRRAPSWLVIFALASGGLCASFMQTTLVPIQQLLPELLGAPRADTAWAVTVTMLVAALTVPIAGRLGDMFGKRGVALASLVAMLLGSAISALSGDLGWLIVGRAMQGVGFAIVPLGIAIMRDVLPMRQVATGAAVQSATMGVGGLVGLPLTAVIAEHADWHLAFWVLTATSLACFLLVLFAVPPSTVRAPGRFDWIGAIGLSAGLSGALVAISRGPEWGWLSPATLGCGIGGLAVLLGWGWAQLRASGPLVDLRLTASPVVLLTNLASGSLSLGLFCFNLGLPQFLANPSDAGAGFGLDLITTSLLLLPSGLMMLVLSPVTGGLVNRFGAKRVLVAGAAIEIVGYAFCAVGIGSIWETILISAVIGVGSGLAFAAVPPLIMGAVPVSETSAAIGVNALVRLVGSAISAVVVGVLLAAMTTVADGVVVPSAAAFQWTFLVAVLAALVCAVLAALIPRAAAGNDAATSKGAV